jgi:Zn-dependent protease
VELTPERIALALMGYVVLLFSLSVHESAHGWMALRQGDDTAARQGRITLNPLSHIDPLGTLLIPLLQFLYSGIPLLGWAKPTPVGAHNFRRLARGHVLVAFAGPASNLLLAVLFTGGLFVGLRYLGLPSDPRDPHLVVRLLTAGVQINVVLALFNLVPLPPLDGSWLASWGLPRSISEPYDRVVEPYGQWILLILFATGLLGRALRPFTSTLATFLLALVR